jgi:hypothetical protein
MFLGALKDLPYTAAEAPVSNIPSRYIGTVEML